MSALLKNSFLGIVVAALLAGFLFAMDPASSVEQRLPGTVVAGHAKDPYTMGKAAMTVLLADGRQVVAMAPTGKSYPFNPGDNVIVTVHRSLLFRRRSYQAVYPDGR